MRAAVKPRSETGTSWSTGSAKSTSLLLALAVDEAAKRGTTLIHLLPYHEYEVEPLDHSAHMVNVSDDGLLVDAGGQLLAPEEVKEASFVIDAGGDLLCSFAAGDQHAALAAHLPVASAGKLTVCDGRLLGLSNESSQYAPPAACLRRLLHTLATRGFEGLEEVVIQPVYDDAYDMASPNTLPSETPPLQRYVADLLERGKELARLMEDEENDDGTQISIFTRALQWSRCGVALLLREHALQWSKRSVWLVPPIWFHLQNRNEMPVALMPVLTCAVVVGANAMLLACMPKGHGDIHPLHAHRMCYAIRCSITLQSAHKLRAVLATPAWEMELVIRAMISASVAVVSYASTHLVLTKRATMWAGYRFVAVASSICGICGCGALRFLIGPEVTYPPGKVTSLEEAIFAWCLIIVVMALCTPRNRARWWEAWMVVPLHNTHEGGPLAAIACTRRPTGGGRREAQAPIKVQKGLPDASSKAALRAKVRAAAVLACRSYVPC